MIFLYFPFIYVNKIIQELVKDEMKSKEILSIDNYYVSDIVDFDNFTQRDDEEIIKPSHPGGFYKDGSFTEMNNPEAIGPSGTRFILEGSVASQSNELNIHSREKWTTPPPITTIDSGSFSSVSASVEVMMRFLSQGMKGRSTGFEPVAIMNLSP